MVQPGGLRGRVRPLRSGSLHRPDTNENGQLDQNSMRITRVCNGQAGTDGSDGSNGSDGTDGHAALIEVESYASPSCNGVYVRLTNGLDYNNDSNLSIDETSGSRYICLPSQQTSVNATFVKETIEPNSACTNGGVHTYIWT